MVAPKDAFCGVVCTGAGFGALNVLAAGGVCLATNELLGEVVVCFGGSFAGCETVTGTFCFSGAETFSAWTIGLETVLEAAGDFASTDGNFATVEALGGALLGVLSTAAKAGGMLTAEGAGDVFAGVVFGGDGCALGVSDAVEGGVGFTVGVDSTFFWG